ncbi:MAG TPA: sigma-70 family RNA polymerase sigma factor, partial [Candidatus Limnocylindrales bacterium]
DAAAFGSLYDVYAPRVFRFLLARVREPADAEDLLQQVFTRVVHSLPRYRNRGLPFAAWLFRIARNVAVDFARDRRRTETIESAAGAFDGALDPAVQFELAADQERVRGALQHLTPDQRDVVIYRFFADLSSAEIGLVMGKREGSIRALQFRAIAALRQILEGPPA